MAESAHRLDDDQGSGPVYDEPTGTAPSSPTPNLRALEGGGETTEPKRGHLREAGADQPSREELSSAENGATSVAEPQYEHQVGSGYTEGGRGRNKSRFLGRFSRRQKLIGGVGGGLIGSSIIALMLLFLPALRLESYLATIDNRVFAAGSNAVQKRTEKLFERYMISKIIGIQSCGNKVTTGCKVDYSKSGLASSLFNSWQDAKIENKLLEQYGFEVQSIKNPVNGQRFKIVDVAGRFGSPGDELTVKDGKLILGKFEGGPRIFGQEWGKFIKNETRWDQVLQRKSVRKYLTRKHGTKFWCFFACKQKDSIDNAKVSAKTKLQYKLIERTIYPFSTKYGLIMKCLSSGDPTACSPDNLEKAGLNRSLLSSQDLKDLEDFSGKLKDNPNLKLSQFLIEKLLVKMGMDEAAAKSAVSAVPVAGQIYLGLSIVDMLETVKTSLEDGTLSKIAANVTSDQYIEYYTAMRSANDEIKAGVLSADETGALVSQFDDGGQPAEQSKVFQAYSNSDSGNVASSSSSLASIFSQKVYAAPAQTDGYVCSNGQPIPSGQLACSDKTLNKRAFKAESSLDGSLAKDVVNALDVYAACLPPGSEVAGYCIGIRPKDVVHPALQGINWVVSNTLGTILSGVFDVIKVLPGISQLVNFVTNETGQLIAAIFQQIFPLPVQLSSPGRDKYDALEAGGELTASEFNKGGYTADGQPYGLGGGKQLSAQDQAAASQAYLDQQNYDDSHSSVLSRISSIDNPNSLLSRFVAVMPTTWGQLSSSVVAFIGNPFSHMGSIFHPAYAAAAATDINAFGVPRFGYTANDSVFDADPSIYTPEYCQQLQQNWEASKTQDPVTGIDEYSSTDPCLLEQASVEAASSVFTNNDSLSQ
jgi:hypothetical protein